MLVSMISFPAHVYIPDIAGSVFSNVYSMLVSIVYAGSNGVCKTTFFCTGFA